MDINSSNRVGANIRKAGFLIVLFYLLVVLIMKFLEANNFFGYSFSMLSNDIFAPPSLNHFCGTDRLGRDVCLRTLQGSSLAIEVVTGLPETVSPTRAPVRVAPVAVVSNFLTAS